MGNDRLSERAFSALAALVDSIDGGEWREGQAEMCEAIAEVIEEGGHVAAEAATGVGKGIAYLIPSILSRKRTIVATATKNLQNQLSDHDLPKLAASGVLPEFTWKVVKGRGNYLCWQKMTERYGPEVTEGKVPEGASRFDADLIRWASAPGTDGDRDHLPFSCDDDTWREVSSTGIECPGRDRCPQGEVCFAFKVLEAAQDVDVVVTNHAMLISDMVADHQLLGDADIVVVDEAHKLEDALTTGLGFDISPRRLRGYASEAGSWLRYQGPDHRYAADELWETATKFEEWITEVGEQRIRIPDERMREVLAACGEAVGRAQRLMERGSGDGTVERALSVGDILLENLRLAWVGPRDHAVEWTEDGALHYAPLNVADMWQNLGVGDRTTILCSATLTVAGRMEPFLGALGYDGANVRTLAIASPFDYENQSICYVAANLPDPRTKEWEPKAIEEARQLIEAAGGRALVLCTSWQSVNAFGEALRSVLEVDVLIQGELGRNEIISRFRDDETSVLVATLGYWEGIDVPGRSLSLVILDKVPFPRPDDPLWSGRREKTEREGGRAFADVDLPRAVTLITQGAGRLIRASTDTGVVAILDPRVATKSYGRAILDSMPPMRRSASLPDTITFLSWLGDRAA